ncbi:MAG: leucyl/phenylalanyl-tRNA--protein transferase [Saprospiraceae bacterium]|nr:leucyl/phenylalanyl-tRNA--protein transferase [Saprospiraceae bacterium]
MAFYLPPGVEYFPHPLCADPDGLLAIGTELSAHQLLLAYQFGIFPWYHEEDPILWWYTHPRCVLFPSQLKISKSMRQLLKKQAFNVSFDSAFKEVIQACQLVKREGQDDTWITDKLIATFIDLHEKGYAHSIEVWQEGKLVGGLYGLALGKMFYGESMFSNVSNASKYGFIKLVQYLETHNFELIDCQQRTEHLISLGAEMISSDRFYKHLKTNIFNIVAPCKWVYAENR